jgi:hypothetical protein
MSCRIDAISGLLLVLGADKIRLASADREVLHTVTAGDDLIERTPDRFNNAGLDARRSTWPARPETHDPAVSLIYLTFRGCG